MAIACSVYIATSVDGFIARPDGDIEWLHNPEYADAAFNGLDYKDFMSTVDAIVMGRNSYEKVRTFGFWPYEGVPVIVLTRRSMEIPSELQGKIRVENATPEQLVSTLESEGMKHLYIDGGVTIQGFLKAGLITELVLTRIPVLLGAGISLFGEAGFGEAGKDVPLKLIATAQSENGFVQVRYKVLPAA